MSSKNRVQKQFNKKKIWQKPRTLRNCTSKKICVPKNLRLHLASWNLPDFQSSWKSMMEPSVTIMCTNDPDDVTRTNHQDKYCLNKCPKHLVASHFCELRLHTRFQLPRLCRSGKKRSAAGGWAVGSGSRIMPRCGSILQAETCQILSSAENPRWSRVWQFVCQN